MVLESELPHNIVDLLLTVTDYNNKLAILWEELTFSTHLINALCEMKPAPPSVQVLRIARRVLRAVPGVPPPPLTLSLSHSLSLSLTIFDILTHTVSLSHSLTLIFLDILTLTITHPCARIHLSAAEHGDDHL
jgi:hypothetical protein